MKLIAYFLQQSEVARGVRGKFLSLFLCLWVFMPSLVRADDVSRCISGVKVLSLLGGAGDAPIVPVRINGRDAAMYLSIAWDRIYLRETESFPFHEDGAEGKVIVNGYHKEDARTIVLNDLEIGGMDLGNVGVVLLNGLSKQAVDGRPVVGVLGLDTFANLQVLVDMPHEKVAYIKISDEQSCRGAARILMGPHAVSVSTNGAFDIPITIDGQAHFASLDMNLNVTALPSDWQDGPELAPQAVRKGKLIVTHYSSAIMTIGHEATVFDFRIGGVRIPDGKVSIQRDIDSAIIGTNFFENHVVLYDYPNRTFYFSSAGTEIRPVGHDLHFDETVGGNVSVRE